MSVDQISVSQAFIVQMSVGQKNFGQMSVSQIFLNQKDREPIFWRDSFGLGFFLWILGEEKCTTLRGGGCNFP